MAYEPNQTLDCSGMSCPLPILKTKKAVDALEVGQILKMIATDPGSKSDMEAWTNKTGNKLLEYVQEDNKHIFFIEKS
ncbi:MAG: sulfurtransferase TusA family protein [Anaerolineaceae bacterium]|nr:sulfurtransferase TusA family protein [Anaerolineaceae bacterium]